ncbi:phospholipase C, phosphocholine-specific [Paraburkholderia sediminicola]|uniref:phosphocholine-specific phospholipase C n=1 Tax=Paraburkholderia sediminicola TaxID=458836 RepID=UPI0038B80511
MIKMDRRNFLRTAAAGAALSIFPPSIQRALAIPANNATGTIADVEHVIIFMQENRSFDHYFGTMPGVRGYSDRFTIPMLSGNPVWFQNGASGTVQPYYLDPALGNGLYIGGDHSWATQQAGWDNGRMASWPKAKSLSASMGYLQEGDLPFHYALANAFTICDAYHCSMHCSTFPNRMYLWSGTNGSNVVDHGVMSNDQWGFTVPLGAASTGLTWTTYPERLQAAGVSWKVYCNPTNCSNDNQLGAFASYRQAAAALTATGETLSTTYTTAMDAISPLLKGIANTMPDGGYLAAIAADIAAGTLPQVSWVVSPASYSEHPISSVPNQGAWYIQKLLDMLTANPDVWSKTVLFIDYDENDAFFDHMPPPDPPSQNPDGTYAGMSTVETTYEYFTMSNPPGTMSPYSPDGKCFGPGVRTPMLVISPWSAGGWVNSQVFDHTSTLRFLEQRFGVAETNISPWRRAVFGDLLSCFNFRNPNTATPALPAAPTQAAANATYTQQAAAANVPVPVAGSVPLPQQALVARPSRALPYALHTSASANSQAGVIWLTFSNTGTQGAVFHVYDRLNLASIPRRYTVESGKQLSGTWNAAANTPTGQYSLWVLGPNGFHRLFEGNVTAVANGPNPEVRVCYDHANNAVYLTIMNTGNATASVTVAANAYRNDGPWIYSVPPGTQVEPYWTLSESGSWYDFTLTMSGGFVRRFAGRVETGQDGISDPAMGVSLTSS